MKSMGINAVQILEMLREKHSDDVFVRECKNGPTWGGSHLRLDAWVMKRSWAKQMTIGYEVKVSRSDWVQDKKMHLYKPLCNQLYLVAPAGIVQPGELPDGVGLMVPSKNLTRLYTKKKAVVHETDNDALLTLLQYVVMSRSTITNEQQYDDRSSSEYWRRWIEQKKIDHEFGRHLSGAISKALYDEIKNVRRENDKLQNEAKDVERWKSSLADIGIDPMMNPDSWGGNRKLEEIKNGLPESFRLDVRMTKSSISNLANQLEKIERQLLPNEEAAS